jgi:hypothetical protein
MSQPNDKPTPSPDVGAQQSSPLNNGESFGRAENLLAVGNEDSDQRARQAFVAIEEREAAGRPANLTNDSDALTRRITGDQHNGDDDMDPAAADEVDDALDEKALEEGVAAANDTSRIVLDLTPHNL